MASERREQVVHARGHEHVTAEHGSTFELTSDDYLTPAGDCILGIGADTVPAEFPPTFVSACQSADTTITARIEADGHTARIVGRGDPELSFRSTRSLVGRTSDYVDERTVMVGADTAAADVDRELVTSLADGAAVELRLTVE